jgi:hypothetical protein
VEFTAAQTTSTSEDELTRVLRWRHGQLTRAGFDPTEATTLAVHLEVDLHDGRLVRNGCPSGTALRILL